MKKLIRMFIPLLMIVGILSGCNFAKEKTEENSQSKNKSGSLQVYTTIYPLQFFTEQIGGNQVSVKSIIPPGTEAHSFEPTQKTMVNIAKGDMFIYSGTGMEGFANKVVKVAEGEKVFVVKAAKGINLIEANEAQSDEEEHGEHHEEESDMDPHIWLDPARAIQMSENIKEALVQLKPDSKEYFEQNYNVLKQRLESLDQEFKEVAGKASRKEFVVSHSAYGYWEDAYGLKQIGISGLSPTDEPSQQKLKEIIQIVKERNISYIFFETNLSNKVANVVKNETGANVLTLHNLETLTTAEIKNKEDYFTIMTNNISSLQKALQ
ncbi:MAG: metal ABC transporter substrate-binding protein [Ectobacillus sp.]